MSPMSEGICSTSGMENSHSLGDRAVSGRQELGSLEIRFTQVPSFARSMAERGKTHVLSRQKGLWFKAGEEIFCANPRSLTAVAPHWSPGEFYDRAAQAALAPVDRAERWPLQGAPQRLEQHRVRCPCSRRAASRVTTEGPSQHVYAGTNGGDLATGIGGPTRNFQKMLHSPSARARNCCSFATDGMTV